MKTRCAGAIQVDGGGPAVVRVSVQLRGPAGDLLGLSAVEGGDAPERRATGLCGLVVHVGLRGGGAVRRTGGRPLPQEIGDPRRAHLLVADHAGDGAGDALLAPGAVPRAGRIGRGLLLSGVDVADQFVARQGDAFARHELASIQRLRGHDRGRNGGGLPGGAFRMAQRLLPVRVARRASRAGAAGAAEGTRGGGVARRREIPVRQRVARRAAQPDGGRADGGLHLRQLRRRGLPHVAALLPDIATST